MEPNFLACNLGDDDVVAFLCQEGLTHNNTMQSLELDSNCFGDKGVMVVATLIASNDQLFRISIKYHNSGDESMGQIGHALKHNTNLKSLNVLCDYRLGPFSPKCLTALLDGIKEHPTLIGEFGSNGFNAAQIHELWYHLKSNCGAQGILNAP